MHLNEQTVAVVTGAASGIGRGIALELARRGCRLALVDIDEAGLTRTQALAPHAHVSIHRTDVGDLAAMQALAEAVVREHGGVHVLVNNAGVSVTAPLDALKIEDFEWLMRVNFWGVVFGCKVFLPYLRREKEARICNVLSDFALVGFPTKSPYCASKFAVRGFSESLQAELYGSSVGVTCVYPGPVDTGLVKHGRAWDAAKQQAEADFVARRSLPVEKVARRICDGLARNRRRVLIGKETYLIDFMKRLAPSLTTRLVGKVRRRLPFL